MSDAPQVGSDWEVTLDRPIAVRVANVDSISAEYANVLHVNFDRAAFQVVFSQFLQPVITSPEDARKLAEQGFVTATPVARLIFTRLMIQHTIDLLQRQLANYDAQFLDDGEPDSNAASEVERPNVQ